MSTSTIVVIIILVITVGYFILKNSSNQNQQNTDPDGQVLDQLKKAGSDLSKVHDIEFFLYFPNQETAENVKKELIVKGFTVELNQSAKGQDWLCQATKKMLPVHTDLVKLRKELTSLAVKYNGEYDGWGTQLVQ